ncbi:MAG: hypothetical protein LUC45_08640 [Paraprevotella sp.]|nr:hypothetical protein [Paraprevotella sp.]
MRKLMVAVCFALLAGGCLYAQNDSPEGPKKMDPEQMAKRMAGRLMLDDATTANFVPLYQEYMQKLAECRTPKKEKGAGDGQTDAEIDARIQARFDSEAKSLDVQKSYYDKFKKVLTMKQVEQLYNRRDMPRKNAPKPGPDNRPMPRR